MQLILLQDHFSSAPFFKDVLPPLLPHLRQRGFDTIGIEGRIIEENDEMSQNGMVQGMRDTASSGLWYRNLITMTFDEAQSSFENDFAAAVNEIVVRINRISIPACKKYMTYNAFINEACAHIVHEAMLISLADLLAQAIEQGFFVTGIEEESVLSQEDSQDNLLQRNKAMQKCIHKFQQKNRHAIVTFGIGHIAVAKALYDQDVQVLVINTVPSISNKEGHEFEKQQMAYLRSVGCYVDISHLENHEEARQALIDAIDRRLLIQQQKIEKEKERLMLFYEYSKEEAEEAIRTRYGSTSISSKNSAPITQTTQDKIVSSP